MYIFTLLLYFYYIIINESLCFNSNIRSQFPILNKPVIDNQKLIYLDNASGTHLPLDTINIIKDYYETYNSNVYRSQHYLANKSTQLYKQALDEISGFICTKPYNLIFTSGASEAIRLLSLVFSHYLEEGDDIIISKLEHLSNVIPWKLLSKSLGININYAPVTESGVIDVDKLIDLITNRTKLITLNYGSSVFGTIFDTHKIASICHERDIAFMLDGCQAIPHIPIDVYRLGCDFFISSGHKIYGPSGVGFLCASTKALEKYIYPLHQNIIPSFIIDHSSFYGTPPIAQVIGLANSIKFVKENQVKIISHEARLREYLVDQLSTIPNLNIYMPEGRIPIVSFTIKNISSNDISIYLDTLGIAIRSGHQCSPFTHKYLNIPYTCRVSLAMYNDKSDIDSLIGGLKQFIDSNTTK